MAQMRPPAWHELPSATRSDLARIGGRSWYDSILPVHRVGSLNVYMKLKQAGLWNRVKEVKMPVHGTGAEHVGKFDFIVDDPAAFRKQLNTRSDFSDPGIDAFGWTSRQDVTDGSLHFKQFGNNESYVNAHVDQAGLAWYNPWSWIRHGYDWWIDGYQDVAEVSRIIKRSGLDWSRPVTTESPPRAPAPVDLGVPHRDATPRHGVGTILGARQRAPLRFSTPTVIGTAAGHVGSFPGFQVTARPAGARFTQTPRSWAVRGGRPIPPVRQPRFDFTVDELPGTVQFEPGGRIKFPGVQITAHQQTQPGEHADHPSRTTAAGPCRFDWSVSTTGTTGERVRGPGTSMVPSLTMKATPRPNLLQELGDRLEHGPDRYRFEVWQEPGQLRPRPGGGVEFPPMHVVACPQRPNLLHQLGDHLDRMR